MTDLVLHLQIAYPETQISWTKTFLGVLKDNTGQQNLTFFLAHEEKYLILIELLALNSNV